MNEDLSIEDVLKEQRELFEIRKKTLKRGKDVLHISHIGNIDDEIIIEIENELSKANLRLSHFNEAGLFKNELGLSALSTCLILSPFLIEHINGIGTNATWDAIKFVITLLWKKVKGQEGQIVQSKKISVHKIDFYVEEKTKENSSIKYHLSGEMDANTFQIALEKMEEMIKNKKDEEILQQFIAEFDKQNKRWTKKNLLNELREKYIK